MSREEEDEIEAEEILSDNDSEDEIEGEEILSENDSELEEDEIEGEAIPDDKYFALRTWSASRDLHGLRGSISGDLDLEAVEKNIKSNLIYSDAMEIKVNRMPTRDFVCRINGKDYVMTSDLWTNDSCVEVFVYPKKDNIYSLDPQASLETKIAYVLQKSKLCIAKGVFKGHVLSLKTLKGSSSDFAERMKFAIEKSYLCV